MNGLWADGAGAPPPTPEADGRSEPNVGLRLLLAGDVSEMPWLTNKQTAIATAAAATAAAPTDRAR